MSDFIPYQAQVFSQDEQRQRVRAYYEYCSRRRSIREFSDRAIPREVLETIILTAGTAPSGAHKQPWNFVVVTDPHIKHEIRIAAEKEEKESYERRMPEEWLQDLQPFGTDWHKEFLEIAPALIVVFTKNYSTVNDMKRKNYYVKESVGIACGFLLSAIHHAGLVSLTHTPSPMEFLAKILKRPDNEKPFLLIPVGYPADGVQIPNLVRKPLQEICVWV